MTRPPAARAAGGGATARAAGGGAVCGVLIGLSLPPFGFWPLGLLGLAGAAHLLSTVNAGRGWRARLALGAAVGVGQYVVGLWWVTEFHAVGYVALVLLSTMWCALALAAVRGRGSAVVLGLPAALALSDWLRGHLPWGGLPIGGLSLGQAGGPLAPVSRLGGPYLLTAVTALSGTALAALGGSALAALGRSAPAALGGTARRAALRALPRRSVQAGPTGAARTGRPAAPAREAGSLTAGVIGLATVMAVVVAGRLAPAGTSQRRVTVAAVQGGGVRGLRGIFVDPEEVFTRQLRVAATVPAGTDLVVLPEDVLATSGPAVASADGGAVAGLARRLGSTVEVGVVEDAGPDRFRNASVVWAPDGSVAARYDKVHRVPFGEYVPGRALIAGVADLAIIPRDAIAGHGSGMVTTPLGRLGVVISFEVFFPERARSAIAAGGRLLLVPTNASSYRTSQVPTQEVAAARLRAWETGRWVVQAAPTGYSAVIDPWGRVLRRSRLGAAQAVLAPVRLRTGRTPYVAAGDGPVLALALGALVLVHIRSRRLDRGGGDRQG